MPTHIVQQGDHMSSIAEQYGFRDFKTIWDHANNAALKAKRKDPHILFPGDSVFIPDKTQKSELGPTTKLHTFTLTGKKLELKLRLIDVNDQPRASLKCEFSQSGLTAAVSTGGDGTITREIPKTLKEASLVIPKEMEIPLHIGHLDPVEEQSGQIGRLNNLGYNAGKTTGPDPEQFRSAVEEFQCDQKIKPVTGICDAATQEKLKTVHGC